MPFKEENNTDNKRKELYNAAVAVLKPRKISEWMEAGGVDAAAESGSTIVCLRLIRLAERAESL